MTVLYLSEQAAGRVVVCRHLPKKRSIRFAGGLRTHTSVCERAARPGHLSGSDTDGTVSCLAQAADVGVRNGNRTQQKLGIGMDSVTDEFSGVRDLHKTASIHHGYAMRDVTDHGKIMGNEKITEFAFPLKAFQEIDDLALIR